MKEVTIYTKEYCPYCVRAKQLLESKGVNNIKEIRIDLNEESAKTMIERTQRKTVPQIFIGDYHVGGCDDLMQLNSEKKLDGLLA